MKVDVREIAEKAVKRALELGAQESVAIAVLRKRVMYKFSNNQPTVTQTWHETDIMLYAAKEGKMAVAVVSAKEDVEAAIKKLIDSLKVLSPSKLYAPLPEPAKKYPEISEGYDPRVVEKMYDASDVVEDILNVGLDRKLEKVAGIVNFEYYEKALVSSKGANLYDKGTRVNMHVRMFADPESSGQWSSAGRKLEDLNHVKTAERAAEIALMARGGVPGEPGKYDTILSPMVVANFMSYISWQATGLAVIFGMSFFADYLGKKIGPEYLTIYDDGTLPRGYNSTPFDDEGVPTRKTPIIDGGIVKNVLHNTKTAKAMKTSTTGNAGLIEPRPWNIVIEPGDYKEDELFREVKRGLYITNVWYTRFQNYREGVFSSICRDGIFLIENGEIKKPVRNLRISDVMPKVLSRIAALTKERYSIYWWDAEVPTLAPFVLVKDLNITKPTK